MGDDEKKQKELLENPPAHALLHPGTRNTTVAERFNSGQSTGQNANGQAAGTQLLSLIKGGGNESGGGVMQNLFGGHHAEQDEVYEGYPAGKGQGYGQNSGRRRRKPKGAGKGESSANSAQL